MASYAFPRIPVSQPVLARLAAAVLCLAAVQVAHAVEWNRNTDFFWSQNGPGKISVFPGQGSGNVWTDAPKPRFKPGQFGPEIHRPKALPFNPTPGFDFKARFSYKDLARRLVNPGATVLAVATSVALQRLMEEACLRVVGGEIRDGALWQECVPGTRDKKPVKRFASSRSNYTSDFPTPEEACRANSYGSVFFTGVWRESDNNPDMGHCQATVTDGSGVRTVWTGGFEVRRYCPNGAGELVPVASNVRVCSSADEIIKEWRDIERNLARQKLESALGDWTQADFLYGRYRPERVADIADDWLTAGGTLPVDRVTASPRTRTIPGQTVTTTTRNPDGTTTTTTTTTQGRPHQPGTTTNGNTTTTVTNVTNVYNTENTNNTTINITHNVTDQERDDEPEDEPEDEPKPNPPGEQDLCKRNPNALACVELGEGDGEIPKSERQLTFEVEDLFGGGRCPADFVATLQMTGPITVMDMTMACDKIATYFRPMLILLCTMAGFAIIVGGINP